MNSQKNTFDTGQRVRIVHGVLLSLGLLLLSAAVSFCLNLPARMDSAAEDMRLSLPFADPEVTAAAPGLPFSEEDLTLLSAVGDTALCRTADLPAFRTTVCGMEPEQIAAAVHLVSGRMPENEAECILLPCRDGCASSLSAVGDLLCIPEGTPLAVPSLTVVGIGENIVSAASQYLPVCPGTVLYTLPAAFAPDPHNLSTVVLLTGTEDSRKAAEAVQNIGDAQKHVRGEALAALQTAEEETLAKEAALAEKAVTARLIRIQELVNHMETDDLRIRETGEALLAADDLLQSEIQQFNAEMEIYEYYATNQVTLIGRKNLKEESFAKKRVEIEELRTTLSALTTDREQKKKELAAEKESLAVLEAEAEAARQARDTFRRRTEAPITPVSVRADRGLDSAVQNRIKAELLHQLLPSLFLLAAVLLLLLPVPAFCRGSRKKTILFFIGSAVLCAAGALLGGMPFASGVWRGLFPDFAKAAALPLRPDRCALAAGLVFLLTLAVPALSSLLTRRTAGAQEPESSPASPEDSR